MSALPDLDTSTGCPPPGRHRCSEADLKTRFVDHPDYEDSATRADIWEEYELARDLLRGAIRVHGAWIGGGFISSAVDPSDVDVTFVVSARDYNRGDVDTRKIVESFLRLPRPPIGARGRTHGFGRVDSHLLFWSPLAALDPKSDPASLEYCAWRGYWDDFWQRKRSGSKTDPLTWRDALPRRGYVEVDFDAYTR